MDTRAICPVKGESEPGAPIRDGPPKHYVTEGFAQAHYLRPVRKSAPPGDLP